MSKLPLHKFTVVAYPSLNGVPTSFSFESTDRTTALEHVRSTLDKVITGELQRVFVRQESPTMCYIADQRFTPLLRK